MHETCWGGGAAVPGAIGGVSREGLGKHRWLLSCVRVCGPYRMTAGIIDEQLVLLRAYARIVLMPSNGLAGLVRLPCAQVHGLCLNADDVADLARRLLRAQMRGLCCSHGAPVPPALRLPCVQGRIVLATGNQLRAAYCVTVRASACRARSSAWMVEAGVCPATPTSPGPPVRRAQVRMRHRAGNGPRRVRVPTP